MYTRASLTDILATILARKSARMSVSVSVSVSAPWNSSVTVAVGGSWWSGDITVERFAVNSESTDGS